MASKYPSTNEQEKEVEKLKARISALEEENDLLAMSANRAPNSAEDVNRMAFKISQLEEENQKLSERNRFLEGQLAPGRNRESTPELEQTMDELAAPFMVPGDRQKCIHRTSHVLRGCHGGANALCARLCPGAGDILASGGADKTLVVSRLAPQEGQSADTEANSHEIGRLRFAAPVLSLDFCPNGYSANGDESKRLLLAGCMDGSSHLVRLPLKMGRTTGKEEKSREDEESDEDDEMDVSIMASLKDHSKYVVACRWAPDGSAFVTASHDKVVTMYKRRGVSDGSAAREDGPEDVANAGFEQATRFYFPEAVECVEFTRKAGGGLELVISARSQPHLTYVDVETLQQRKVSLNEKDWDTHVSFTVMSMSASADGKYLLAATDKSRCLLWPAGSNVRVRTLVGHSSDEYFQPRVAWDPSGSFSYCNSSGDHAVHVHCLASGRVVDRLKGHTSVVRDLYHDPSEHLMASASYDKTVRVWGQ